LVATGIVAALATATGLGLWFTSTRPIAILSVAALAYAFPWLAVLILMGSATAFYLLRIRK
jgi:hypothetical protein